MKKVLIISDSKPGHLNQSIAFVKHKKLQYDIVEVKFNLKLLKLLSYALSKIGIYANSLFSIKKIPHEKYCAVISTGSTTYYANTTISQKLNCKSIAIMFPKGYDYKKFDYIIAQQHDTPPKLDNVTILPINPTFIRPNKVINLQDNDDYIGIILGGDNNIFKMEAKNIKKILDNIFLQFNNSKIIITTSRRTPIEVEKLLEMYPFYTTIVFSKNPINPIPDMLDKCSTIFISEDSTSMISEACSFGKSNVEIISLKSSNNNSKFEKLINHLERLNALHRYDLSLGYKNKKICLDKLLPKVTECE